MTLALKSQAADPLHDQESLPHLPPNAKLSTIIRPPNPHPPSAHPKRKTFRRLPPQPTIPRDVFSNSELSLSPVIPTKSPRLAPSSLSSPNPNGVRCPTVSSSSSKGYPGVVAPQVQAFRRPHTGHHAYIQVAHLCTVRMYGCG